jgi:hypothetical protein
MAVIARQTFSATQTVKLPRPAQIFSPPFVSLVPLLFKFSFCFACGQGPLSAPAGEPSTDNRQRRAAKPDSRAERDSLPKAARRAVPAGTGKRRSQPADCARSPGATSDFGLIIAVGVIMPAGMIAGCPQFRSVVPRTCHPICHPLPQKTPVDIFAKLCEPYFVGSRYAAVHPSRKRTPLP